MKSEYTIKDERPLCAVLRLSY